MSAFNSYKNTILADSPIRYYRMSDASKTNGSSVADIGSQAQNGTVVGTTLASATGLIRGDSDGADSFDGNDYITVPTTSLPTGASSWSMECWIKMPSPLPTSGDGFYYAMTFGTIGTSNACALLYYRSTATAIRLDVVSNFIVSSTVSANGIYHLVGTYNGTVLTFYVNGVSQGTYTVTLNISSGGNAQIANANTGEEWVGVIDEACWYSTALTSTQVSNHYHAGLASIKALGARTRLSVLNTKSVGARTRLRVISTKTVGARTRLVTATTSTKSVGMRTLLRVLSAKSVGARTRLSVLNTLSVGVRTRLVIVNLNTKSVGARTRLRVVSTKTVGARSRVSVLSTKSVGTRTRLGVLISKTMGARTRLRVLTTKAVGSRVRLSVAGGTRTLGTRTRLSILSTKSLGARARLRVLNTKSLGVRTRLLSALTKSVGVRVRLAVLTSGKVTCWANGTGTATFDRFRATQYPDPSLSLAPVIPRIGTSLVQWNALVPANTSLGIDLSTDGVNWTDVSSGLAMAFNGSTGYISLPTTSLPTGASPWSLEAWCELAFMPVSGYHALIGFGTYLAQEMAELSIQSTGTTAQFVLSTYSGDIGGPFTIQLSTPYHIVGTYDGTSTRLYINGALIAGPSAFTLNITLAFASIGAGNSTVQDFFPGTLDEPAIYATALSTTQIANHYAVGSGITTSSTYAATILADGPIRYYHLDDANTTAIDTGSQGQNGTLHGGITQAVAGLIASRNGLVFPQFYTQPDPTIDGFASNTSANYTSTFRTGGVTLTATFDTANSRIILTGGTNGIYAYTAISRADVDFFADLDQSDAGGMVWRFVDANNFYYLLIADNQASLGMPNTITLYRVASNVQTQLAQANITFYRGLHYRFRVAMLSNVITASLDGTQLINYTDATPITSAGQVGLYNNGGTVGSRYSLLWVQPQGDNVTGGPQGDIVTGQFVYTRARLATTDPTATPQIEDLTTLAAGPNIRNGVSLATVSYNAAYIGKTYDDLAKASAYAWYIGVDSSGNKTLYFRQSTAIPSPWILQSNNLGLSSDLEQDTNLVIETANNTLYRNRQILLNVIATGTFGNTFVGDGKATTFTLSYPLASGFIPTITLNGVAQKVGLKGTTGSQWYYAAADPVIAQDTAGVVLQSSDSLVAFPYQGTYITNVTVDNVAAQQALQAIQKGTGIVEEVEDVSSMGLNVAAALTYGQQLLARNCIPGGRTATFKTYRQGIDILQTLTAFVKEEGVNDVQLLVTEIDTYLQTSQLNGATTQLYGYIVIASELPYIASWPALMARNLLDG